MKEVQINIIDIINTPNAIIHKYGIQVYEVIKKHLSQDTSVNLSFNNLKNLTSGFCNASIGRIYADFPTKALQLLSFSDINNYLWLEKINEAIYLAQNPMLSKKYANSVTELFQE